MRVHDALGATLFGAAVTALLLPACGSDPQSGATAPADEPAAEGPQAVHAAGQRPRMADGLPPGMKRRKDPARKIAVTPTCNNPKLAYFGGPVVQSPIIVPVFWNSNVNAAVQASMSQFYSDVMASSYWGWLHEYDTVGLASGTHQVILPGTATPGVVLTPSRCNAATTTTCKLSDSQVQAELNAQIAAGVLPAPTLDCTGNAQTIYMIDFPTNVQVSDGGGARSCVQFCAYHSTGKYGSTGIPLIYGILMDQFAGGCATGCGGNAQQLDNMTETASHELIEAITDPDIGLVTAFGYAAPAGWGDNNNQCGEIGDICDNNGPGDTITVSGRTWVVQQEWSNKQNKCTSTGTAPPVCAGQNLTGCRPCGCGDSGGACNGATAVCETGSGNVLFGACEQCSSQANTCGAGNSCQQSATPAQDDVCVGGCTPATTCPAPQDCGTASDGCGGTLACGACAAPRTCGGGGKANQCGCAPAACPAGLSCGMLPDGCGGMINCGSCTAPQTCGGGGVANVCGCTPATACPAGDTCGTASDGCGGTVPCGTCGAGETCAGNVCTTGASSSSSGSTSTGGSSGTGGSASTSSGAGGAASSSGSSGTGGAASSSSGAATGGSGASGASSSGHPANPGQSGGCGCRTAGDQGGPSRGALSALGMLAVAGCVRVRRRRRA